MCSFDNRSFPSVCEVCDTKNPTYDDALRAVNEQKRAREVDRGADAKGRGEHAAEAIEGNSGGR